MPTSNQSENQPHTLLHNRFILDSKFELEIVCAFIFVFGLLGNGLTLWILVQSKKWKKNTTNMFIVSLTTVQDFDSTFKNYFAQVNACILNFKMSDL